MRISSAELHNKMVLDPFWGANNKKLGYGGSGEARHVLEQIYAGKEEQTQYTAFKNAASRLRSGYWPLREDPQRHLIFLWCALMDLPIYSEDGTRLHWAWEFILKRKRQEFYVDSSELKVFLRQRRWPLPTRLYPKEGDHSSTLPKATELIDGREAVPVRLIPFIAGWGEFPPDVIARILAGTETRLPGGTERLSLSSYCLLPDSAYQKMSPPDWDVVVQDLKDLGDLPARGERHSVWRREAIKTLPAGTFVWLQDLERVCEQVFHAYLREKGDDRFAGHLNLTPYIPAELRNVVYAGFKDARTTIELDKTPEHESPEEMRSDAALGRDHREKLCKFAQTQAQERKDQRAPEWEQWRMEGKRIQDGRKRLASERELAALVKKSLNLPDSVETIRFRLRSHVPTQRKPRLKDSG